MPQKKLRIGIVGCGAIGSSLALIIGSRFSATARLAALYDIDKDRSLALARRCGNPTLAKRSLADLLRSSQLVVEATAMSAAFAVARAALTASCDVMVMSVGGLLGKCAALRRIARHKRRAVFIPSGAVAGIDGLKAAAAGCIGSVTLTTTKPLRALRDAPGLKGKSLASRGKLAQVTVFKGNALQAASAFPQNINVAATISLAGCGPKKTQVRIVASSATERNIHELTVSSSSGIMNTRTENCPHPDNPKTSYQAVLSAAACLSQILDPIKIGT